MQYFEKIQASQIFGKVREIIQNCIISQIFALCREYGKLLSIQTGKSKIF